MLVHPSLDIASAMPSAAVGALDLVCMAAKPEHAHQSRDKPHEGREERESNDSLCLAAWIPSEGDIAPVEDGSARAVFEFLQDKLVSPLPLFLLSSLLSPDQGTQRLTSTSRPKTAHQHRLMMTSSGQLVML